MGGPCDDAAFRRAIAGIRRKNARTKAATLDQNCQETPAGAQDRDGSPPAIWLVWPELLVSEVFLRVNQPKLWATIRIQPASAETIMQRDQFGDVGGTLATNLEPVGKASAGLA